MMHDNCIVQYKKNFKCFSYPWITRRARPKPHALRSRLRSLALYGVYCTKLQCLDFLMPNAHSLSPMEPRPIEGTCFVTAGDACVRAGFPSPAADFAAKRIDLTTELISHPQATFLLRVAGSSMCEEGIDDGDLILVDRAIKPQHRHIVVGVVDNDFTVKKLHLVGGVVRLKAGNPTYPDIVPREGQTLEIWGVVTACIKRFKT